MMNQGQNDLLKVEGLSFTYPGMEEEALVDLSFEVEKGSFTLLCGPTGSGKTTLLRALKEELRPTGKFLGHILAPPDIAFVLQDPANQIVMDRVWHELAFGLENRGLSGKVIERRIAETAHFFGIEHWINRPIAELSGGEKQILNLASSLILNPSLIILDEPTARLDPVAVTRFLSLLEKIHQEIGTTILLSEHRMTDVLPLVNQVLYLEGGHLLYDGEPRAFASFLLEGQIPFSKSLPAATKIVNWAEAATGQRRSLPALSVPEARKRLNGLDLILMTERADESTSIDSAAILKAKGLSYRYKSDLPLVLEELSLHLLEQSIHAVLGGNGSGKSTLLYLLSRVKSPTAGKLFIEEEKRVGLLTQNARALFSKDHLKDELMELHQLGQYGEEEMEKIAGALSLLPLLSRHPYDLSGGEMQKAALAKLLLLSPDILLLDEPDRGLDAAGKEEVITLLRKLRSEGKTILFVSHDLNFTARVADRVSLLFDGRIVVTENSHSFFSGNNFYTTDVARVTRGIIPGLVVLEDLDAKRFD